jgi:hypothetical protein
MIGDAIAHPGIQDLRFPLAGRAISVSGRTLLAVISDEGRVGG